MPKYLFYISYLGTRFCGTQFQLNRIGVQNAFNNALALALQVPSQAISTRLASRTDSGVHALRTSLVTRLSSKITRNQTAFELKLRNLPGDENSSTSQSTNTLDNSNVDDIPFDPDHLAAAVNHILKEMDFDVRVLACRTVSDGFCPRRHAILRTYLYRLAVLKSEYDNQIDRPRFFRDPNAILPVVEKNRCWAVDSNFDREKFSAAGKLMQGLHNFESFSCTTPSMEKGPPKSMFRNVKLVECLQGQPLINPRYDPLAGCFDYIDVLIHSKSFVYRQIRKMVGFMVHVAQNKAHCSDVRWLLDHPSPNNWSKYGADLAPSGGLYLMNISYNESDFDNPNPSYEFVEEPERFESEADEEDFVKKGAEKKNVAKNNE
uniref:tRNA pseudouridine synthase n=1 Tax=Romanomermis culicivorax TaxID=13658 RepID=A0A915K868_ROMCU